MRLGWHERPLDSSDFRSMRLSGPARVGAPARPPARPPTRGTARADRQTRVFRRAGGVLEVTGLPQGVPRWVFLVLWQRIHWDAATRRMLIRPLAQARGLQLAVPPECAGWRVRALVAPLLSDGALGYVGTAETPELPGRGQDGEVGSWEVAEPPPGRFIDLYPTDAE